MGCLRAGRVSWGGAGERSPHRRLFSIFEVFLVFTKKKNKKKEQQLGSVGLGELKPNRKLCAHRFERKPQIRKKGIKDRKPVLWWLKSSPCIRYI